MNKVPVVAIVGRPNVGKSSLLNALANKRVSIVQDMPGVTRDRVTYHLQIPSGPPSRPDLRWIELMDTGGYGFIDPDGLTEHIRHQIEIAISRADLVLFLVDSQSGLTGGDLEMANLLRAKGINTVMLANKADSEQQEANAADFARLGLGTPLAISALRDRNLELIFKEIGKRIDLKKAPKEMPEPEMLMAIVGKRNAGKSTLVNSIAKLYEGEGDRVIVSEVPGTTRDSVDVRFEKESKTIVVIDTAGVRKKRHMVTDDIQFYSFHRAQRSIRRAGVVLLLLDATADVSEPDKKLAEYVHDQYKPVILVVNKWDLAREELRKQAADAGEDVDDRAMMEKYREYLGHELRHVDYAPIAFITAKDGRNVQVVVDLAQHLFAQAGLRVGTGRLNAAVKQVFEEKFPSTPQGRRAKVYYATQADVHPPHIVLFVNNPDYLDVVYQRFMLNRFRELLPYGEVPIKLTLRGKAAAEGQAARREKAGRGEEAEFGTLPGGELIGESDAAPNKKKTFRTAKPSKRSVQAKSLRPGAKPVRAPKMKANLRGGAASDRTTRKSAGVSKRTKRQRHK